MVAQPPVGSRTRNPRGPRCSGHRQPRVEPLPEPQTNTQRRPRSAHRQHPTELRVLRSPPELASYTFWHTSVAIRSHTGSAGDQSGITYCERSSCRAGPLGRAMNATLATDSPTAGHMVYWTPERNNTHAVPAFSTPRTATVATKARRIFPRSSRKESGSRF